MTPNVTSLSELTGPILITLTASQPTALIFYSLDGSIVTNSSVRYTAPFLLSAPFNGTLRCAAFVAGYYPRQHSFTLVVVAASLPVWCVSYST